jgi:hypothetical protein
MALMYPNKLINVASYAEVKLYEAFRDHLDNNYYVFHSVHWQSIDREGRPRDGEADFIIINPHRGILIIEVKGGSVQYNPRKNEWITRNQAGVHDIKNPVEQAVSSKYTLISAIKRQFGQANINIGHAVAFPDVDMMTALPRLEMPRDIILDRGDLSNVASWVNSVLFYWSKRDKRRDGSINPEVLDFLRTMLSRTTVLKPLLWSDIQEEKQQLIELTQQQFMILDLLSRQRRALISGCAGSGKTTLATEKAIRLAKQGFRVLLVCYNKSLATYLRNKMANVTANLRIYHFHHLCIELARQAYVLPQAPSPQDEEQQRIYFEEQLPDALLQARGKLFGIRYDAIIIDEGQDFREEWLLSLMMLLHDPDGGIFYIFYDDNQRLYDRSGKFPLDTLPYTLTVNCRTTQEIHKQIVRLYEGSQSALAVRGPRGRPVERVLYSDPDYFLPRLGHLLKRLVQEEQVPNEEIVILTPLRQKSWLWEQPMFSSINLARKQPPGPSEVFATTIHDFKGLESPIVILVEVERWSSDSDSLEALLYVACSRACNHLILLQPVRVPPILLQYFS